MPEKEEPPAENAGGPDAAKQSDQEVTGPASTVQRLPNISAGILTSDDDARRSELCAAALSYAAHGWRVIPVRWITPDGICSCQRGAECTSPGKHPVHDAWPDVATCEPVDVASWWRPEPEGIAQEWFPYANVGIVTGRSSGIWVLDEDTYSGGAQTLGAYERRNGALPPTRIHSTGRGGTHYIWRHPGFDVRNSAKKVLGAGLDIRGENGFIVAPPSQSASGPYELNPAHDTGPADAPEWLLDLLRGYDRQQTGSALSGHEPAEATGAARKYAEAALASESERMRGASADEHNRNVTLNECAFSLGTLGGAGLLSEDAAWQALREAALATGLGDGEIRGTFLSGWHKGLENPRNVQWRVMGSDWPTRARTEFGLADRMADHFGDQLRYCPEHGTWMEYRAGCWVISVKEAGEWAAQAMLRRLPETEGLSYDDHREIAPDGTELPSQRDEFENWVGKQQTRKAVSSAARLAVGLPLMRMSQDTFDADPMALNCRSGVVDMTTGELQPHDPELRMTLQCAASYANVPTPKWDAFLRRVQPDPEMRAYLQRVAGYSATGLTSEQVFFLMHGQQGANGKSVFQSVLAHVLGTYSQTIPVDTLMASSVDGRIPNDVARMSGKRFLIATETKAGKAMDEPKLKQLTGGDTVSARYMRGEYFDFKPVGKINLSTNHLPRMSDDAATWRRIHVITWPVHIPEEERDGDLPQTLIREEAAGILHWIVQGALAWQAEGLNPPEAARAARDEYRTEEDVVGQFVDECLEAVPPANGVIGRSTREIWTAYRAWAGPQGHPVMGQKALTARLGKKHKHVRANGWSGFPELQVKLFGGGPGGG